MDMIPSRSCRCLNIRMPESSGEIIRISVVHPRLIDIIVAEGESPRYLLACLLCRVLIYNYRFTLSSYNNPGVIIRFQNLAFESVTIPDCYEDSSWNSKCLTDAEIIHLINSPAFSPTFGVLLCVTCPSFDHRAISELGLLELNRYPSQLSDVASDLCNVLLKRSRQLRAAALLYNSTAEQFANISAEECRMRSEFQQLCRLLWKRHCNNLSPPSNTQGDATLFVDFIQFYLNKIDAAFSQPTFTSSIKGFLPFVGSAATVLEGASRNEYLYDALWRTELDTSTRLPCCGFNLLPVEITWKIMEFLGPSYVPIDLISANNYCAEYSAFAELMLVSKSWSKAILPVLYETVVLFANPESLNKLACALGAYGPLVRTIIVDDVGLGPDYPDIHIRTCKRYIDKCINSSTHLLRIECYGDYQLTGRGSSELRPPCQIRTLILGLPHLLPYDIPGTLALTSPNLEHLEISGWEAHPHHPSLKCNSGLGLPLLTRLELRRGSIDQDQLTVLLSMASSNGSCSLRSLSISDMSSLDVPAILALLKVNEVYTQLTTLRIGLADNIQLVTGNDLPLRLLALCPSLVEFSYTSPASIEIFKHLTPSLRVLELAVLVPHTHCSLPPTATSSIAHVKPFIEYISTGSGKNIKRLSILRRMCPDSALPSSPIWKRLDIQCWDDISRLRDVCRRKHIILDCMFVLV